MKAVRQLSSPLSEVTVSSLYQVNNQDSLSQVPPLSCWHLVTSHIVLSFQTQTPTMT